ncbi:hypothetical protein JK231_06075 [Pantoea sp. JGM49]|uniref:hypothetical protein n=1 Tax=Pantoea sp. JGM49 TaxID=2799791 RepID=UPI001BA7D41F|nr:hypothetical protein [Pantoea sp. JGM49]MBS0880171.1 hypothetical protein [Pantoea sp. JGM49]
MSYITYGQAGYATPQGYANTESRRVNTAQSSAGGYVMPASNTTSTSWLGAKFAKIALIATLLFSTGGLTTNQHSVSVKVTESSVNARSIILNAQGEVNENKTASPQLSNFLKEQFGFKTAQWAAILQVERKTLYNWEKNPETKIQNKVVERLMLLQKFYEGMDKEHAMFLSKLTFGKHSDSAFLNAFNDANVSFESLMGLYDEHYIEIDGLYKRLKHSV